MTTVRHVEAGDSALMLGALAGLAYAASLMTHEAVGHGIACLMVGGHNSMLSSFAERCTVPKGAVPLGVPAAGPLLQCVAGLLAWAALRIVPHSASSLRWLLWCYMVFGLFVSTGYVAFSGVTNFGDAAVIIAGLTPTFLWRALLILLGGGLYYLALWATGWELNRLMGEDQSRKRVKRLIGLPYLTAGVIAVCAGALNHTTARGLAVGLGAASSLGAGVGLIVLPGIMEHLRQHPVRSTVYVRRNLAWVTVAGVLVAAFIFVFGAGLERPP